MKSFNNTFKKLALGTSVLAATVLTGCFATDSGSKAADVGPSANLVISVGVKDVNNLTKPGLAKTSIANPTGIVLRKLVITLTSSIGTDAVIRDTIFAHDSAGSAFKTDASVQQSVLKNYSVKPLRNWTVQVKTIDENDSVIHISSKTENNLQIGETRAFLLNLTSNFIVYVAKFELPDSIGSADVNVTGKQALNIKRFMMVIDGDTVRDTSASPGYFASSPDINYVTYNYVSTATDTHEVRLYVYTDSLGGMGSWDPSRPLFADTILVTDIDSVYAPELPYTGPGSPSDPNYDPLNPGGAVAGLEINIGAVGQVELAPTVNPNPLPRRKK
jgi:hypothetical protein